MSLFARVGASVLGDDGRTESARPSIHIDRLSSFLPWRVYDKELKLYLNRASVGFVAEVPPLVGADERIADILTQFFSESLPKGGACVQILNWGSPRVSPLLGRWFLPRYNAGPVYERMARHRLDKVLGGVWASLSEDAPFHVRNHRVIISVGVPGKGLAKREELAAVRSSLFSVMRSIDLPAIDVEPLQLLALVDDLTSPTTSAEDEPVDYNEYDSIADQAIRRDIELHVEPARLLLRTERFRPTGETRDGVSEIGEVYPDHFDIRHFAVRNFPQRWAPWDCARLIGDMFTDKLRLPCPAATVLCLQYQDEEAASSRANYKFMRTTSLADSKTARFVPALREQSAEWKQVQEQLQQGLKLVRVFYGVTLFSVEGDGDQNERTLKSIYRSAGWDLSDERFLQIQGLLVALPLTLPDGLASDFDRLKRFRTFLTSSAAALAPLQGEYLGASTPHMLMIGRRGQPFFWSPFENGAGNHNVAIIGKSGSGKSVLLQELCSSLVGAGAKVVVIDDGRSFQNSVKLQGGAHIEFTMASGFGLNPFSMIDAHRAATDDDYKLDCMAMLKAIVGQMARYLDHLSDAERGLIDSAVNSVWGEHGRSGSIDLVAANLSAVPHGHGDQLAIALKPFCSGGTYAGFFSGEATLQLDADFTVFELSDLATREELRSVVLTAIMFMTTQLMTRTPRSVKKLLLIDEAWQMLRGGSMASFVETYARTCRKYGGAVATATQSLNDYYKSEGAQAALENSDWMLVMQQKPETIAELKKNERLEIDTSTEAIIRSLKRNGTEYSEVFIKGPDTQSLGRLVLDQYSATVFSSSPDVFARIERLVDTGLSVEQALDRVAFPDKERNYAIAAE